MPYTLDLGGLSIDNFLDTYWQQKPYLVRQAIKDFSSPIDANELAGLAMEDFVESRLVKTEDWSVAHGPFSEASLSSLPESNWTLLVQGVDQLVPEIATLLESFRFLPAWRLDDIMVTFASEGGGVGPHFDHYDVFLLQVAGKRRWQLGDYCDENSALVPDIEMAILKDFDCREEFVLEPGDMLYLPPKLAHWGTAIGDCMTYSIGFRAPSSEDILYNYIEDCLTQALSSNRYRDNGIDPAAPNRIPDSAIEQVRAMLLTAVDDKDKLSRWFGRYMTERRYELHRDDDDKERQEKLASNAELVPNPAVRLAYTVNTGGAYLFALGRQWRVTETFAKKICAVERITAEKIQNCASNASEEKVVQELIELGVFIASN